MEAYIEVPNKENHVVLLRDLLESEAFKKYPSRLAFAVGKDIRLSVCDFLLPDPKLLIWIFDFFNKNLHDTLLAAFVKMICAYHLTNFLYNYSMYIPFVNGVYQTHIGYILHLVSMF